MAATYVENGQGMNALRLEDPPVKVNKLQACRGEQHQKDCGECAKAMGHSKSASERRNDSHLEFVSGLVGTTSEVSRDGLLLPVGRCDDPGELRKTGYLS